MTGIADGEIVEVQGSGSRPYILKNTGGVFSCSCPAWRNQSAPIERRTCKHLKKVRGAPLEEARIAGRLPPTHQVDPLTAEFTHPSRIPTPAPAPVVVVGPPLLLANSWDGVSDPTGWWMSEKLDGVRAYWNGTDFISRLGNLYHAPDWFKAGLPAFPLDGELWIDRKAFQETVSIVRRQDKSEHWRKVRFVVFDAPGEGDFETRLGKLATAIFRGDRLAYEEDTNRSYAQILQQDPCQSVEHLRAKLAEIEAKGGEGLMLRKPGSLYVAGRSETLLKVKSFYDAEARVVGHTAGKGRHKGRVGALEVEALAADATGHGGSQALKAGTRFSVGTGLSDAERLKPPPLGTVITFRYQELTDGGTPRFPSFVRIRPEDV